MDIPDRHEIQFIGRYKIEARIGHGGMGQVFKAYDPQLGRMVALKTILPGEDNPLFLERLKKEARACAGLHHSGIVVVHDIGEAGGTVFIAMEYLEGRNLAELIKEGCLTAEQGIQILIEVLEALQCAHEHGVIHRDVKPSNVLISPNLSATLVDFGLARTLTNDSRSLLDGTMGTPNYMSPEQLTAKEVDWRTDVYSAGVMAYELFTSRKPFDADSITAVMMRVINEDPPEMNGAIIHRFPAVEEIVLKAIAKRADQRFASAREMADSLRNLVVSRAGAVAPPDIDVAVLDETALTARDRLPASAITGEEITQVDLETTVPKSQAGPDEAAHRSWMTAVGRPAGVALVATIGVLALVGLTSVRILREEPSRGLEPSPPARVTAAVPTNGTPVVEVPREARSISEPAHRATTGTNPSLPTASSSTRSGLMAGPTSPASRGLSMASMADTSKGSGLAETQPRPAPRPSRVVVAAEPEASTAEALYSHRPPPTTNGDSVVGVGLKYRVIRLRDDGKAMEVDPGSTTFYTGDGIRFVFEANVPGHLYVAQHGASGSWNVLFPHPGVNRGMNSVRPFTEYAVSGPEGWFWFDETPGTERIVIILTSKPLVELRHIESLTAQATLADAEVTTLQQRLRSRDLVFSRPSAGRGKAHVVNRAGGVVITTIELMHRN